VREEYDIKVIKIIIGSNDEYDVGPWLPLNHPLVQELLSNAASYELRLVVQLCSDQESGALFGRIKYSHPDELRAWQFSGTAPPATELDEDEENLTEAEILALENETDPGQQLDQVALVATTRRQQVLQMLCLPITALELSPEVEAALTDPERGNMYWLWQVCEKHEAYFVRLLEFNREVHELKQAVHFLGLNLDGCFDWVNDLRDELPGPPELKTKPECEPAPAELTDAQIKALNSYTADLPLDKRIKDILINDNWFVKVWYLCNHHSSASFRNSVTGIGPAYMTQIEEALHALDLHPGMTEQVQPLLDNGTLTPGTTVPK